MKVNAIQLLLLTLVVTLLLQISEARIKGSAPSSLDKEGEERSLYYNNKNNNNNGGNYYGRRGYYPYYRRRYWNKYYQGDDAQVDDAQVDDAQGDDAQGDDNVSTSWASIQGQATTEFQRFYHTSPGEWSTWEWAIAGGACTILIGFVLCICVCCNSGSKERKSRNESKYDFDDYTSLESRKGSSSSGASGESTDFDDNATYDSIMRLRSD